MPHVDLGRSGSICEQLKAIPCEVGVLVHRRKPCWCREAGHNLGFQRVVLSGSRSDTNAKSSAGLPIDLPVWPWSGQVKSVGRLRPGAFVQTVPLLPSSRPQAKLSFTVTKDKFVESRVSCESERECHPGGRPQVGLGVWGPHSALPAHSRTTMDPHARPSAGELPRSLISYTY